MANFWLKYYKIKNHLLKKTFTVTVDKDCNRLDLYVFCRFPFVKNVTI